MTEDEGSTTEPDAQDQDGSPQDRSPGGGAGGRARGPAGAAPAASALEDAAAGVRAWLQGRLPAGWTGQPPEVAVDRDEVSVVLVLPEEEGTTGKEVAARFRERTREERIALARGIERQWNRSVAWGVVVGGERTVFTSLSVPTMTRLRQPERLVLDVLVDSGVARSRSEALAWCVRLVGQGTGSWLGELRAALRDVDRLRAEGPTLTPPTG